MSCFRNNTSSETPSSEESVPVNIDSSIDTNSEQYFKNKKHSTHGSSLHVSLFDRLSKKFGLFVSSLSESACGILSAPHRCIMFAYFEIDHITGRVIFYPASTIFAKWVHIVSNYFRQIGCGSTLIGLLLSLSLLPLTLFVASVLFGAFWLITIPHLLLIPITFGLSLVSLAVSLIIYGLIAVLLSVLFISLWIGLIAALFGIGFVYKDDCDDDKCSDDKFCFRKQNDTDTSSPFTSSDSTDCTSTETEPIYERRHNHPKRHSPPACRPTTTVVPTTTIPPTTTQTGP